jgi:hypothetical protein
LLNHVGVVTIFFFKTKPTAWDFLGAFPRLQAKRRLPKIRNLPVSTENSAATDLAPHLPAQRRQGFWVVLALQMKIRLLVPKPWNRQ